MVNWSIGSELFNVLLKILFTQMEPSPLSLRSCKCKIGVSSSRTSFEQGRNFLLPRLQWYGTSVFTISFEGPPIYDKEREHSTDSNPTHHGRIMIKKPLFNRLTFMTNFPITSNAFLVELVKTYTPDLPIH